MADSWVEVRSAKHLKKCDLVINGDDFSKRIEQSGLDRSIFELQQVTFLQISNTKLKELPEEIGDMQTNLKKLVLYGNVLTSLPCCYWNIDFFEFIRYIN